MLKKWRQKRPSAPTFKGMAGLPRQLVPFTCMRRPMTASDKKAYFALLDPMPRLVATTTFALFTLYPTLVSSVAKVVNCSDPVGGKRYLLADFSVTCYTGWHTVYLCGAVLCSVVYCFGIPVLVFFVVTFKTPWVCRRKKVAGGVDDTPNGAERDENEDEIDALALGKTPCHSSAHYHYYCPVIWRCVRRSPSDYKRREVRTRFGFLFHGYETDGAAFAVGWEANVMMRKLFVTLAGAGLSDVR